jgi:hemoglobin-like flavoprotein
MSASIETRATKSSNRPARSRAEISLTAEQKRLIRESFVRLEPALDLVGELFYLKLYRLDPSFRDRFGSDPETLGRKFMAGVRLTIVSLKHEDCLTPIIKLLGLRQRQLGMKVRDYRMMSKAWMWTLERSLEKSLTRQTKDAWTVLLGQITRVLSGSDVALLRSVG